MNKKIEIEIKWLTDIKDCASCGSIYNEGAVIYLNSEPFIDMSPIASCVDGAHYEEADVYLAILKKLGYSVNES